VKRVLPLVTNHPSAVFRFVHRDDRGAYSRIMRRTMAVQFRELNRAMTHFQRQITNRLLPTFEELTHEIDRLFREGKP
jgi:hypothetical protein